MKTIIVPAGSSAPILDPAAGLMEVTSLSVSAPLTLVDPEGKPFWTADTSINFEPRMRVRPGATVRNAGASEARLHLNCFEYAKTALSGPAQTPANDA